MGKGYWHRQSQDKPLFPELLWSRPENKRFAGKLLIIGGNSHGFAAPAEAYQAAEVAGVGVAHVMLPDAIHKLVSGFFENAFFAPSTPSGSFGQKSIAEILDSATWADGVLLAGDLGRNAETAIVVEAVAQKYIGPLIVTKDGADYFKDIPNMLFERPDTTLVISLAQLQKMVSNIGYDKAITFGMSLIQLVDTLHGLTTEYPLNIIVKHLENILVASGGQVSTTHLENDKEVWRIQTAAVAGVWLLQNPKLSFEALTTAVAQL